MATFSEGTANHYITTAKGGGLLSIIQ